MTDEKTDDRPPFAAAEEVEDVPLDLTRLIADRDGWKQIADERWKEIQMLRARIDGEA